jgi:hypothetical protein
MLFASAAIASILAAAAFFQDLTLTSPENQFQFSAVTDDSGGVAIRLT